MSETLRSSLPLIEPAAHSVHPALRNVTEYMPLRGMSGAQVWLARVNGAWVVRKCAHAPSANERLLQQVARMRTLNAKLRGIVKIPEVIQEGTADDCMYFDMAFVSGVDAASFFGRAGFHEVKLVYRQLERFFRAALELQAGDVGDYWPLRARALQKVKSIAEKCRPESEPLLHDLCELLYSLPEKSLPARICHGDLTLENMIVDRYGALWMIDPSDSLGDHIWMDFSKLFQDFDGYWYERRAPGIGEGRRTWCRQHIFALAHSLDPDYPTYHRALLALNFARILPYARAPQDVQLVVNRLQQFVRTASPFADHHVRT